MHGSWLLIESSLTGKASLITHDEDAILMDSSIHVCEA